MKKRLESPVRESEEEESGRGRFVDGPVGSSQRLCNGAGRK